MAIRLQNKDEIAKAQAQDRQKEIAEGLKISRRVDSLRELQAEEEKKLELFRNESLSAIGRDVEELTQRKAVLEGEVGGLEKKLSSLSPQIVATRKEVIELHAKLKSEEERIATKSAALDLKEIEIAEAVNETRNSLERQRTSEESAHRLGNLASSDRAESEQVLKNARKVEENILKKEKEIGESLTLREAVIAEKEKVVASQIESNTRVSRDLEAERIRLNDQRLTLERALERLRKNRLT